MLTRNEIVSATKQLIEVALPSHQGLCEAMGQARTPCLGIRVCAAVATVVTPPGSINTQDLIVLLYLSFAVLSLKTRNLVSALVTAVIAIRHIRYGAVAFAVAHFRPTRIGFNAGLGGGRLP